MYDLLPPYVAISQTDSIYGVTAPYPGTNFGYIQQVNFNTISYNVGDRVLYDNSDKKVIFYDLSYFDIIDENKIILKET